MKLNNIPDELKRRDQWLFWNASSDKPRKPLTSPAANSGCTWNDPDEWHSFEHAKEGAEKVPQAGVGFVNAKDNDNHARGLIGSIDIDGAADEDGRARDWVPSLDPFSERDAYQEWSPSGTGLRVPVIGLEIPDWWSDFEDIDGEHKGVELLTNKFSTYTGDRLRGAGENAVEYGDWLDDWLREVHKQLAGEDPLDQAQETLEADSGSSAGSDYGADDEWLTQEAVESALDAIDPDAGYDTWKDIGMALVNHLGRGRGGSLFKQWSRRGTKWDSDAKDQAERIIDDARNYDYDAATIVHHAKGHGWDASGAAQEFGDTGTPDTEELASREVDRDDSSDDGSDGSDEPEDDTPPDWGQIYNAYQNADSDETDMPRYQAAMRLLDESDWRTLKETDDVYHYDPEAGIFRPHGDKVLRQRLGRKLKEQYSGHERREVLEHLYSYTTVPQEDLGGDDWHICTENCVLELSGAGQVTQKEHSPEYDFLGRVQTEYDPDADCPRFQQFLDESVRSGSDKKKLQEYAGYALMHWALPYHKALFLVGPTASGKSTFLDTIRTMLGDDSVASLTPQQMTAERFGGAELFGAWANIRNDIPNELIENTGEFKELVAGDPVKAEKKYQDPFKFEPKAKHMFSANELPEASTDDRAFYRRILLVAFPHETPRPERDYGLDDKLQAEHAGILNWALTGLQRLLDQGGFTGDRDPWQTEETWEKWSDSAKRFYQACLDEDPDDDLATADVWQAYLAYCDAEGIPAKSRQAALTKALKTQGIETGRVYDNGSRNRALLNVTWTGRGEELFETAQEPAETTDDSDPSSLGGYGK